MALVRKTLVKRLAQHIAALPVLGPKALEIVLRRKYGAHIVTPAKTRNFLLAHREHAARLVHTKSLPFILNLDTVNACNLRCPCCPTGTKQLRRAKTRMPLDVAKATLDKFKDHLLEVRLYNWGEPFLNPDIFDLIAHARDARIHSIISSNMSVKVEDLGERVLSAGLRQLRVSIDGLGQETLETYRRRADFELIRENIRSIVEAKKRHNSPYPKIECAFLVFRHNEHEAVQLNQLEEEWGVDSFFPGAAFIYSDSFVPRNEHFQPIQTMFDKACQFLYFELMVEADGHVSPCCTNTDSRFDIGSVEDLGDLHAFWNSPIMQRMRKAGSSEEKHAAEEDKTLCHYCAYIGTDTAPMGSLSPLPPSMVANHEVFPPV